MDAAPVTRARLERVLVVDDDSDMHNIVLWALNDLGGLLVHACNSGGQACVDAPVFAPDLLIIDIAMPGMNGWQTMAALRALPQTASTPVIFFSANEHTEPPVVAPDPLVIGFIAKPFDPLTFATQVRNFWTAAQPH